MKKKNLFVATSVLVLSLSTASFAGDQPVGGNSDPCKSPTPPPQCPPPGGSGGGLANVETTRTQLAKLDFSFVEELVNSSLRFLGLAK